jgi:hypothetical protein
MSIAAAIRRLLAPLDHRLRAGDGKLMLMDAKSLLRSLGFPRRAHTHSHPIATIASAQASAGLIGNVPTPLTTDRPNSNPHRIMPPRAWCQTARGFLLQGLSAAYLSGVNYLVRSATIILAG